MADKDRQDEHKLIARRRAKLEGLRTHGNAFPNHFRRDRYAQDLQDTLGEKSREELEDLNKIVKVAGRIMARRGRFIVLQDVTGRIQAYIQKDASYEKETDAWDIGDIVGVEGYVRKSRTGDLFIRVRLSVPPILLTKSLRPLPEKFHGLTDVEKRYRRRYLDLIMNETSRRVFATRTRVIQSLRDFLHKRRFVEVETPMMQAIPGGAAAKPFVTHHNALDMPLYMRVAPELYLKRLVVGGMERVFEINRSFRNEGLSTRHNPEFTMLEFYQAYADYRDLMDLTENMLRELCEEILQGTTVRCGDEEYDFGKPFARMTLKESILHFIPQLAETNLNNLEDLRAFAGQIGVEVKENYGIGKLHMQIFEKGVEERLRAPTFITAFPTEVSPLARTNDADPAITDRFEFFVGGREIANGFSELNDPEEQARRFRAQAAEKDAGNEEAMHYDGDYIRALEYGLPPTAGEGIGIDRLVMLLTDSQTIRDVILFPHLKPK